MKTVATRFRPGRPIAPPRVSDLEKALITHARGLLENAFPDADSRWIEGASRLQVLGDRAGLADQEKRACQVVLAFMDFGQSRRKVTKPNTDNVERHEQ
ncbi:hypothetical protein NHH63_20330 [Xanthomonas campestris pv. campestris]|uniref:hypothetical protein n=1 Tax=Xanthomonas campestris TaxID=339 RepID=UPI00265BEBE2|nr:hypothetical protein [Xanthomonas campestris]MDO0840064.1 hypothetical protein [Xanthomonas campestris pv. campestris]